MNIRKIVIKTKWIMPDIYNKIIMKLRKISYGRNLITYGKIFIRGRGIISLGNGVIINSCCETNPIGGGYKTILFAKETGRICIGNNVGISNTAIVALKSITIENNVMIGGNCKIYDHDFHSVYYHERMQASDPGIKSAPVLIKQGAFIGAHCIILKGVTIGKFSVIGAGSVVTKDVPDKEIWAGNPARFIKKIEADK